MAKRSRHGRGNSTLPALASLVETGPPEIRRINHSVLKDTWVDPDDLRPNVRTGRTVTGHRAFCPLRWCQKRHGGRSSFNEEHVAAADRLRVAFDGARLGFAALKDWRPIQSIAYRPSMGPTATALRQLRCRRAFDRAWNLFDSPARRLLALVVLENLAVGPTAETLGLTKPLATQKLVEALDRLVVHFGIRETRRAA
jgi:hypothetical protein